VHWCLCGKLSECFSERRKTKAHQFEMLAAKRNTDDGNAEQQSENQMRKRYPDTAAKNPNDIKDRCEATAGNARRTIFNF